MYNKRYEKSGNNSTALGTPLSHFIHMIGLISLLELISDGQFTLNLTQNKESATIIGDDFNH